MNFASIIFVLLITYPFDLRPGFHDVAQKLVAVSVVRSLEMRLLCHIGITIVRWVIARQYCAAVSRMIYGTFGRVFGV
jgi:hypothetical protein